MDTPEDNIFAEAVRRYNRKLVIWNLPILLYFAAVIIASRLGFDFDKAVQSGNWLLAVFMGGGFLLGIPALFACWNMVKWIRRTMNPECHPSFAPFWEGGALAGEIAAASAALADGPFITESDYLKITDEWIGVFAKWGFEVYRLDDVVWIYSTLSSESVNMIEVSSEEGFAMRTKQGGEIPITVSSGAEAKQILVAIAERIPWVAQGYAPELVEMWELRRQQFLGWVERRREDPGAEPA
ncbi:MAG: hypothetical protein ABIJ96_12015 [Elusimicrobiota bacterium]